jgi:hypothetical protein
LRLPTQPRSRPLTLADQRPHAHHRPRPRSWQILPPGPALAASGCTVAVSRILTASWTTTPAAPSGSPSDAALPTPRWRHGCDTTALESTSRHPRLQPSATSPFDDGEPHAALCARLRRPFSLLSSLSRARRLPADLRPDRDVRASHRPTCRSLHHLALLRETRFHFVRRAGRLLDVALSRSCRDRACPCPHASRPIARIPTALLTRKHRPLCSLACLSPSVQVAPSLASRPRALSTAARPRPAHKRTAR